jgi:hypothetical protein
MVQFYCDSIDHYDKIVQREVLGKSPGMFSPRCVICHKIMKFGKIMMVSPDESKGNNHFFSLIKK